MDSILKGKRILLGTTGGIALYKSCELLRRLQDAGASVRVVMTPSAETFVTPLTFAALSGFPVFCKSSDPASSAFQHIDYPRWCDLMVIAPCSGNSLGRLALGIADEPVSLCYMASTTPKVIVPAMNTAMYQSVAVERNLQQLKADGCHIVEPGQGRLACGEEGAGRFPEISEILQSIQNALQNTSTPIKGRVLITAGRTEEAIDPVRLITNRSSGLTGVAIAKEFSNHGYEVTLVHGPMDSEIPDNIHRIPITSALEMHQAVLQNQSSQNVLIFCAAVADYRPAHVASEKIKDSRSQLSIDLIPNPNILRDAVAQKKSNQVIVGFALETENALEHGLAKLKKSGADLLVLNTPVKKDSGFGMPMVEYCILNTSHKVDNAPSLELGSKAKLAEQLLQSVESILK